MTQEPVLRRKVLRPRPRPTPEDGRTELARALPRALVRAVSAGAGLTAQVGAPTDSRQSLDELLDLIPEDGFVGLLSPAAADGGTGLAVLDQALFSGLIEAMTLGRLSQRPPGPRRPTGTDAALLGAVLDQVLAELVGVGLGGADVMSSPGAAAGPDTLGRWQMVRAVSDLRMLGAVMDDCPYRKLSSQMQLTGGEGRRDGVLTLLLPQPRRAEVRRGAPLYGSRDLAAAPPDADDPFQSALEAAVMAAPVQLNTVLGRVPMTLSQAMELAIGQRLELPLAQLEEVQVLGLDGQPQALARLGQSRGMRALRIIALTDGPDSRGSAVLTLDHGLQGAGPTPIRRLVAGGQGGGG
jgi:flagellar motor switch protein FliM